MSLDIHAVRRELVDYALAGALISIQHERDGIGCVIVGHAILVNVANVLVKLTDDEVKPIPLSAITAVAVAGRGS